MCDIHSDGGTISLFIKVIVTLWATARSAIDAHTAIETGLYFHLGIYFQPWIH